MPNYREQIQFELEAGRLHLERAIRLTRNEEPCPRTQVVAAVQREMINAVKHFERANELV